MQEGEYDSEKAQNKVGKSQRVGWLPFSCLLACDVTCFLPSEPSTCGRACGSASGRNHRCRRSGNEAGGQRDGHQRAEEVSQDQGGWRHLSQNWTGEIYLLRLNHFLFFASGGGALRGQRPPQSPGEEAGQLIQGRRRTGGKDPDQTGRGSDAAEEEGEVSASALCWYCL